MKDEKRNKFALMGMVLGFIVTLLVAGFTNTWKFVPLYLILFFLVFGVAGWLFGWWIDKKKEKLKKFWDFMLRWLG